MKKLNRTLGPILAATLSANCASTTPKPDVDSPSLQTNPTAPDKTAEITPQTTTTSTTAPIATSKSISIQEKNAQLNRKLAGEMEKNRQCSQLHLNGMQRKTQRLITETVTKKGQEGIDGISKCNKTSNKEACYKKAENTAQQCTKAGIDDISCEIRESQEKHSCEHELCMCVAKILNRSCFPAFLTESVEECK